MKRKAIVLGIAPCLEEDLFKIENLEMFDFFAVGVDCSDRVRFDIQHACSYHPHEFIDFRSRRAAIGGNLDYKTHSYKNGIVPQTSQIVKVDYIWPLVAKHPESGSSAFLAAQAAIGMGHEQVVLCGCPLVGSNQAKPKAEGYQVFQAGWVKYARLLEGKVRSMSGWTREFLGAPDNEWLS